MKFFQLVKLIIALMPIVRDAIVLAEQLFGGGRGAEKLAFVRSTIEVAYRKATDTADDFEELWPALEEQVALVVQAFNALGIFKKDGGPSVEVKNTDE